MVTQPELEERQEFAEGLVVEAESLTTNLEDDEAKILLDWGLGEARAAVAATREVEDTSRARQIIEDATAHVRRVMKKVNKEMADHVDLEAAARLAKVRSLVVVQAQSFSILGVVKESMKKEEATPAREGEPVASTEEAAPVEEQPREEATPAGEGEPVAPTEEAAPVEEQPRKEGFMARIRSWMGFK
jgi:hypothetical protein